MNGFQAAAKSLAALATTSWQPEFVSITPEPAADVVAIDGSHCVLLDRGAVWVVAVTSHAWRPGAVHAVAPEILVATPDTATQQLQEVYESLGLEAPACHSADQFAALIRDAREMRLAIEAAKTKPALLLIDGALVDVPHETHGQSMLAAGAIGVSKRSSLQRQGVALQFASYQAGKSVPAPWAVAHAAGVHFAKLHPGAKEAYRVDGERIGRLLEWCRDPMYVGYPYPLAAVHNGVALTMDRQHELRLRLEQAVRQEGPEAFALLQDPHAMLDANL